MRGLSIILSVKTVLLSSTIAWADTSDTSRSIIIEGGLSYSGLSRSGSALNNPTPSNIRELESFEIATVNGFVAIPIGKSYLFQIEGINEITNADYITSSGNPARFTYDRSSFIGAQVGRNLGDKHYLGLFSGTGSTELMPTNAAQARAAANYNVFGVSGAYHTNNWSFTGQFGRLDADSQNAETISNFTFSRFLAQRFFNQGKTAVNVSIAIGSGDQDFDSPTPDKTALRAFEVGVEHSLPINIFGSTTSAYASFEHITVDEKSATNGDIDDTVISIGFNVNFGAKSLRDRERRTAQRMPKFGRWLASVPAVD